MRMLNINYGHNKQLMEKCRILEEYSKLVAVIRDCMAVEKDMQTALNRAVNSCIEKGILKEFLLKNRAEVLGMLLEEFDAEKYERTIRSEGRSGGSRRDIQTGNGGVFPFASFDKTCHIAFASTKSDTSVQV